MVRARSEAGEDSKLQSLVIRFTLSERRDEMKGVPSISETRRANQRKHKVASRLEPLPEPPSLTLSKALLLINHIHHTAP